MNPAFCDHFSLASHRTTQQSLGFPFLR
uniref:Uncharacterized protein n=1 Tax=Rhizophora mucronata TaxID=61149 RepID=A0A2P2Q5Y3_RHIMU